MNKHKNISIINKCACVGCGGCVYVCPLNTIVMEYDAEGFLYPSVNEERCINCGECIKYCISASFKMDNNSKKVYACWNKNDDIRLRSSSGGLFNAFAMNIIENGGVVYGASYKDDYLSVMHKRANKISHIASLMGSKYVQSDIQNSFDEIQHDLSKGIRVLFTGTPCEINAIRKMFGEKSKDLLLVSVICHGCPSPKVYTKYIEAIKNKNTGIIRGVNFRNKKDGWKNYRFVADFDMGQYSESFKDNLYMRAFNYNLILRPSCYNCKQKLKDSSDITIGDFWGIEKYLPGIDFDKGVSAVVIRTENGREFWNKIKNDIVYTKMDYKVLMDNNPRIENSVMMNPNRKDFFENFCAGQEIEKALEDNVFMKKKIDTIGFHLFDKWMYNLRNGKKINRFFEDNFYSKIAIYGFGVIGKQIYQELLDSQIEVICGVDQDTTKNAFDNLKIIRLDEIKDRRDIEAIVITPLQYYTEIEERIYETGFKGDVVSIEQVVKYVEDH